MTDLIPDGHLQHILDEQAPTIEDYWSKKDELVSVAAIKYMDIASFIQETFEFDYIAINSKLVSSTQLLCQWYGDGCWYSDMPTEKPERLRWSHCLAKPTEDFNEAVKRFRDVARFIGADRLIRIKKPPLNL